MEKADRRVFQRVRWARMFDMGHPTVHHLRPFRFPGTQLPRRPGTRPGGVWVECGVCGTACAGRGGGRCPADGEWLGGVADEKWSRQLTTHNLLRSPVPERLEAHLPHPRAPRCVCVRKCTRVLWPCGVPMCAGLSRPTVASSIAKINYYREKKRKKKIMRRGGSVVDRTFFRS